MLLRKTGLLVYYYLQSVLHCPYLEGYTIDAMFLLVVIDDNDDCDGGGGGSSSSSSSNSSRGGSDDDRNKCYEWSFPVVITSYQMLLKLRYTFFYLRGRLNYLMLFLLDFYRFVSSCREKQTANMNRRKDQRNHISILK